MSEGLKEEVRKLIIEVERLKAQITEIKSSPPIPQQNDQRKIKIKRANHVLKENITYHQIKVTESWKLPNLTANTIAVIIKVFFLYNGPGSTHGYMSGTFSQLGHESDPEYLVPFNHKHFNWYYNSESVEYIVPWESNGIGYLNADFQDTYNSNSQNTYQIIFVGSIES